MSEASEWVAQATELDAGEGVDITRAISSVVSPGYFLVRNASKPMVEVSPEGQVTIDWQIVEDCASKWYADKAAGLMPDVVNCWALALLAARNNKEL